MSNKASPGVKEHASCNADVITWEQLDQLIKDTIRKQCKITELRAENDMIHYKCNILIAK